MNLYNVTDALYAKGLIPQQTKEDMHVLGLAENKKASKLIHVLEQQLEASVSDSEQYLIHVCQVLINQQNRTLTNIATSILSQLGKTISNSSVSNASKQAIEYYNVYNDQKIHQFKTKEEEMETQKSLSEIEKNFTSLMVRVNKTFINFVEENPDSLSTIKLWLKNSCYTTDHKNIATELDNAETVKIIFDIIRPLYDCIDCDLIMDMCEELIPKKQELANELSTHHQVVEIFYSSTTIKQLKNDLEKLYQPYLANELTKMPKIIIKLQNRWSGIKMKGLKRLIEKMLPLDLKQSILQYIEILTGSVTIHYYVLDCTADNLKEYTGGKLQFMRLIGIFSLYIEDHPVLQEDENMNFTFELALLTSVRVGNNEAVEFLLQLKEGNVNIRNNKGWTALMIASALNYISIIHMLIQANANPHLKLSDGSNAVMIASCNGNYEIVELLINEGVDYVTQQADGWNNFMLASQNGHTKIVELLLEKKVDPYVQKNNGWNALMLACHNGHTEIVENMLNSKKQVVIKKNINAKNENGSTALMIACNTEKEHSEIVQLLLDAGADPHVKINNGKTALASAMNLGHKIIVRKLLKSGAATTDVISIELNEAGVSIEISIIQLCVGKLMKESHLIKFVQLHPTLATIFADDLEITVEQFVEEVKQFISKTNEADMLEILSLLLQATPQCEDDPTSLILASTFGNVQAVDMLLKAGYNPITSLSSSKYFQAISTIMQPASIYKEAMKISCPSLVIACIEGHLELVKSLLRKIHDTNHQQETGETFLMFACDHKDIVQTLLQNGGDPNICDDDGDNVLHYVLLSSNSEDNILDLIKTLLPWNINVNAQNNNGITPLMIARDKKYAKVLTLLSSKGDPIHPDSIECHGRTTQSSLMGVTAEKIKEKFRKVEYLLETFCFYDLQRYQTPILPTLMVH